MSLETIAIISNAVIALATVIMAWFTYVNNKRQGEIKDLFEAIVISNLVDKGQATETGIREFKRFYTGKTKILDKQ